MATYLVFAVLFAVIIGCECQKRGVQVRVTEKGFKYAVSVGTEILRNDLLKDVINAKGSSGKVSYAVINLKVTSAELNNIQLLPVKNAGMRGIFSGITLNGEGKVHYSYRSWIKVSDTIGISILLENMAAILDISLGADKAGHPTIDLTDCSANIDAMHLDFHGGGSWFYNIFRKLISNKLKSHFKKMICDLIEKEIKEKAKSELATFPVTKKIDKYAEIDYHLTAPPVFTAEYMDVFLKGEFKSSQKPEESSLIVPSFKTSSDDEKMIYFWLSEYTINTAGEVYQKSGFLNFGFEQWDSKVPKPLRDLLNTKKFILLFPKLATLYPDLPMSVEVSSSERPRVSISEAKLELYLFTHLIFSVKDKSSDIVQIFTLHFNVTAGLFVAMKENVVTGKITDFDYDGKVVDSKVGSIMISLDNPFIKMFLKHTVVNKVNPILEKGFPLPNLEKVTLKDLKIKQEKGVIRIGSDLIYTHE